MRRVVSVLSWFVALACGARTELDAMPDAATHADACVTATAIIQVPATTPWVDTRVDLVSGAKLVIEAAGTVRYGPLAPQVTDANGGSYEGTLFFATAVLPDAIVVSVIGKVGGSVAVATGTPLLEETAGKGAGFVGASYTGIVPVSGRLFLGFNDQLQAFSDNSGSFTITITIGC